ncbi:hypothetical protein [Streptomyces sp. NRRL S-241]|uniref:hypothetical protein n=1 Tax=Streptomyces sp. NRRL S-241 TaxID=1463896 RepID=UPI0004BF9928|nr:hypothetical protein [Streptomyces sp. NRRL S-241]
MTTVAAEFQADTRQARGLVPLNTFSFHRENLNHDMFRVSITEDSESFVYTVRAWGNMIDTVQAFAESIAHHGVSRRAKVDIFRTGHALVNGCNIRVVPIG